MHAGACRGHVCGLEACTFCGCARGNASSIVFGWLLPLWSVYSLFKVLQTRQVLVDCLLLAASCRIVIECNPHLPGLPCKQNRTAQFDKVFQVEQIPKLLVSLNPYGISTSALP